MANEDLKIIIGAETKNLEAGLARAQKQIINISKAQSTLSKAFLSGKVSADKYEAGMSKLQKTSDRYARSLVNAANHTGKFGKGVSANAVPAMQEFSRVIQDAPYGIQGVANNVQQLTAQFQYLSAKSGGWKNALKGMASSIIGPAGILLAVSLLTTAFIKYEDEILDWIKGTARAREEANRFAESLEKLAEKQASINQSLSSAFKKGLENAILTAKLAGKSQEEQFQEAQKWGNAQIVDQRNRLKILREQQQAADEEAKRQRKLGLKEAAERTQKSVENLGKQIFKLESDLQNNIDDLENDKLREKIRVRDEDTKNLEKELKERLRLNTEYYKAVARLQSEIRGRQAGVTGFRNPSVAKSDKGDIFGSGVFLASPEALVAAGQRLQAAVNSFGSVKDSVVDMGSAIAAGFTNFGTGIADAIANGALSIDRAGNLLLSAFGDLLSGFGTSLIAWGVGKLALENLGISGAAAIAAGTALVIAGKAISAKASQGLANVSNSLGGGSVGGGGSSSFSGSTAQTSSVSTGGRYVFEIEGTKLVGVLSNTLARNRALGGDLSLA